MTHLFEALFKPRSVAVIGASATEGTVGKAVISNLIDGGFSGTIYAVNTKPVQIEGCTSYPSLLAIPDPVDLVIIMIPAQAVVGVMQQAAERGVKAVIVLSAGFKEVGAEGAALEQKLATIAHDNNILLIGPNCLGVLNPHASLNASFAGRQAPKGSVAFISQSGALCTAVLDLAEQYGIAVY